MRKALARRNAALTDMNTQLATGYLRLYTGARPADPDASIGAAVLVATLRFGATAGVVSNGTWTANAITSDSNATGNVGVSVTFARLFQSDGTTPVVDISVGVAGGLAYGPITQTGSSTANSPAVSFTGTPAADYASIKIKISTGGALGVAQFQYSTDDGVTYQSAATLTASQALGATGITLGAAAGTYVLNDVYTVVIQPVELVLAAASIAPGTTVSCSGLTLTEPVGT